MRTLTETELTLVNGGTNALLIISLAMIGIGILHYFTCMADGGHQHHHPEPATL